MKIVLLASAIVSPVVANSTVTARQIADPTLTTEVVVESGRTEVVIASWKDMNVLHTPFKNPKIIKDVDIEFTVDGSSIYFRPIEKSLPFGIFISERDVRDSPSIKLNIISTDLPVGAQLRLKLTDQDWELDQIARTLGEPSEYIAPMLDAFEALGKHHPKVPPGMKSIDIVGNEPVFYGNTLLILERRYRSPLYVIDAYSGTNRANEIVTLNASDFLAAESSGDTDIADASNNAVAFYPRKTLQPGESTTIFVLRARK